MNQIVIHVLLAAAASLILLGESSSPVFWLAAALMGWAFSLYLTEHQSHKNQYDLIRYTHSHIHGDHHRHSH